MLFTFLALDPNTGSSTGVTYSLSALSAPTGSALNASFLALNASTGVLTLAASVSAVTSSQTLSVCASATSWTPGVQLQQLQLPRVFVLDVLIISCVQLSHPNWRGNVRALRPPHSQLIT